MSCFRKLAAMAPLFLLTGLAQDKPPEQTPAPIAATPTPAAATPAPADTVMTEPPPPEVEQALQARVDEFYKACVARKFREAEHILGEESRDQFYNSNKPQYNSYELKKIIWEDNYTKAKVQVTVGMDMPMQSFVLHARPVVEAEWRLVDGQWYLHLPGPEEGIRTPFGNIIKPTPLPADGSGPPPMPGAPAISQEAMKKQAQRILKGVKIERSILHFDSTTPGEEKVEIVNTTPTAVTLQVPDTNLPGLTVTLEKDHLAMSQQTVATFHWAPPDKIAKPTTTIHLKAFPMGQDIAVQVRFSYHPEQNQAAAVSKQNGDAAKRP